MTQRELRACIEELKAEAAYRGVIVTVSRRVAIAADGDVVIALHDDKNTHVRISPNQVRVMTPDGHPNSPTRGHLKFPHLIERR